MTSWLLLFFHLSQKKNKLVNIISTVPEHFTTQITESKHPIIQDYNEHMGGVDTVNHLIGKISCKRRTNR